MAGNGVLRLKLFLQRFWQPTSACMTCMPGSLTNLFNVSHWTAALTTGLVTGLLVLVLTFTPAISIFRNRFSNAVAVGCLTAGADAWSHAGPDGPRIAEALLTGVTSFVLALIASYLFEDRARRLRTAWSHIRARPVPRD